MIVVYIVNPSALSPSSAPLSLKLFTFTFHFITICTFRFESPYAILLLLEARSTCGDHKWEVQPKNA